MARKPYKYLVMLDEPTRRQLQAMRRKGQINARTIQRIHVLLMSDAGKTAPQIAEAVGVTAQTVYNIRRRFCAAGWESAIHERPRPGAQRRLNAQQEGHLIALACSDPPEGRERWTVRLLTQRLIELGVVESIGRETVRRTLKKTRSNRGRRSNGVSPA